MTPAGAIEGNIGLLAWVLKIKRMTHLQIGLELLYYAYMHSQAALMDYTF